jgi:acetate kinase
MRDLHVSRAQGNPEAQLAFEMFCYSIRRQLGALWSCLGHVDAVVFTAGIGENDPETRLGAVQGLESWGISIDLAKNSARSPEARSISQAGARVQVLVIPTNEELEIARTVLEVLGK